MVFKCQENSFLRKYTTKVKSCEPASMKLESSQEIKGFNVILEDTILFPEGGGQPCDFGYLDGYRVRNVTRIGADAVHFVESPVPFQNGEPVDEVVDWERRHDNMQQHSGQHLISAIFEQEYDFKTKAWWLGSETSNIELDAKNLKQEHLNWVEKKVNDLIAEGLAVNVKVYDPNDPALTADVTRANRELPKDHIGPVRIITIDGIDSNMCCGTHVSNLSQLHCVKFLHIERTKNKLLVHFLVGNRVIKKLSNCYNREQELNVLLNGGPQSHIDLLQKLQLNYKLTQRTLQKCLKEIANEEAHKLKEKKPLPKYYCLHRTDGIEPTFMTTFLSAFKENKDSILIFLTVGDLETDIGQMILQGNTDDLTKLGSQICAILDGKGNGKNQRFQAKIRNLDKIWTCDKLIKEYFSDNQNIEN